MHKKIFSERISADDISTLSREIDDGQLIKSEDFLADTYLDAVIDKPWGLEYRVYADMLVDVWRLSISAGQSTSMHCHPRKKTVLICLRGNIRVNFIRSSHQLGEGDFILIPKGVFHSTDSIGDIGAELIEVETPRNKFDLVRAKDKYGRQKQHYEADKSERAIAPLVQTSLNTFAKIRASDLHGDFHFALASGSDILDDADGAARFAISLALEDAIEQEIDVVSLSSYSPDRLNKHKPYLVVSRARAGAARANAI
ncbi:MAG: cupin domain-containing protein [Pseudomonadota bacterium]